MVKMQVKIPASLNRVPKFDTQFESWLPTNTDTERQW